MNRFGTLPGFLLAAAISLGVLPAAATTYVMMSDGDLADRAPLIAEVRVVAAGPAPERVGAWTDYQVEIDRLIKGHAPGSTLVVRVPGGERSDGAGLVVAGAPRLREGERALLLLAPRADGTFGVFQFLLGAFREVVVGGRRIAVRDLAGAHRLSLPGLPAGDEAAPGDGPARSFAAFADWLADRAVGLERPVDYRLDLPPEARRPAAEAFTYLGGQPQRWFVFDGGGSTGWRAHQNGQEGLPGGGYAEFQTAQAAWNGDAASTIRYTYLGQTTASAGFTGSDGVNAILFNDPNGEISGGFSCSSGGVLALGGGWTSGASASYNGRSYRRILEGDVIINDGTGCYLSQSGGANAAEVFAHELGHALGLGHSTVSGALMRATAYGGGRGATLGSDDRAAIRCIYGDSATCDGEPPPTPPAAPTGLSAAALSSTQVRLQWQDNSTDETQFRIEMRATGSFQQVGTTAANGTIVTLSNLSPQTTYTFRVRACNGAGCSTYSNEAAATTPASTEPPPPPPPPPPPIAAPTELSAEVLASTEVRLKWKDNSVDETQFRIEAATTGAFAEVGSVAAGTTTSTITALAPGTTYGFRVRAVGAAGASDYSNIATARTFDATACPPDPGVLCLLGGRFRVQVEWTNQHAGGAQGVGRATTESANTGFFSFFNPANLELVVKMLDGRGITGHFWLFYGALSDLEYDIVVTDNATGQRRTYHNPPGNVCGGVDLNAFPGAAGTVYLSGEGLGSAPPPPEDAVLGTSAAACSGDAETLCLLDGRFQVRVDWTNQHGGGTTGVGTAVARSAQSGSFSFFNPANIELVVKMLDGRGITGRFWLFYGALSDVEYDILVTDTSTGKRRSYHNPPGNICGRADLAAF